MSVYLRRLILVFFLRRLRERNWRAGSVIFGGGNIASSAHSAMSIRPCGDPPRLMIKIFIVRGFIISQSKRECGKVESWERNWNGWIGCWFHMNGKVKTLP